MPYRQHRRAGLRRGSTVTNKLLSTKKGDRRQSATRSIPQRKKFRDAFNTAKRMNGSSHGCPRFEPAPTRAPASFQIADATDYANGSTNYINGPAYRLH